MFLLFRLVRLPLTLDYQLLLDRNVVPPLEEYFTIEQDMLTIDTFKSHFSMFGGLPAPYCVHPSSTQSNVADAVPWIRHDDLDGSVVSIFT